MAGSVRYRLLPSERLPYGPVVIRYTPSGLFVVAVNENHIDPILSSTIADVSANLVDLLGLVPYPEPGALPMLDVRIHRDPSLGGDQLIDHDLTPTRLDMFFPRDLLTRDLARGLELHANLAFARFFRRLIIPGGNVPAT